MRTVLVTGGANGLGAAFAQAYAAQNDTHIIVIDVQPITFTRSNVEAFTLDLSSESAILAFAMQIKAKRIDLIIHSAGVRGLVPQAEQELSSVEACDRLDIMDANTMTRTFSINTIGTFLLLRALLPNLRLSSHPKVVVMSSRMGSLGNNQKENRAAGGGYAYRASKAALNAIMRSFSVDEPGIVFVMCHPGRVETKLVRVREQGAISAEESIQALLPLIDSWSTEDSGQFYDRFGKVIEW